jgi:hypothetical protein
VKTNTENIEAELVEANDDFVILAWKAREPKKIGKGKETSKDARDPLRRHKRSNCYSNILIKESHGKFSINRFILRV